MYYVIGKSCMFHFNSKLNHSKKLFLKCRYTHLFGANYESTRSYVTWPSITVVTKNCKYSVSLLRRLCAPDDFHGRNGGFRIHRRFLTTYPSLQTEFNSSSTDDTTKNKVLSEFFRDSLKAQLDEIVKLMVKLRAAERYLTLLYVRSRIEDLENHLLWPRTVGKPVTRRELFKQILTSEREEIKNRQSVIVFRQMFKESKIPEHIFLDTLIAIYGEFSDPAAYHLSYPKTIDPENIVFLLRYIGLGPDHSEIEVVNLLFKHIPRVLDYEDECE